MGSFWVWTRCQWRRRRGGAFAATLLFALAVGIVLTATAGARRTETAYPRMLEATATSDVLANPAKGARTHLDFDAVEALPGVEALGRAAGMFVVPPLPDGNPDFGTSILAVASADGQFGYTIDRPLLTTGRLPDPERADEVVIDPSLADKLGVRTGDTTTLLLPDLSHATNDDELPPFLPRQFTVTGIGPSASQILEDETFAGSSILLSPAFYAEHPDLVGYWGLDATLADPSADGVLAFRRALDALVPDEDIEYRSQQVDTDAVRRAVQPQVVALDVFAALVALAALVIVGQAMSRQLVLDDDESLTLHAIGIRRRSLFAGAMLRALVLAVAGAAIGVTLSVAASSRFPVSIVRRAEPHPGIEVNLAVLAVGTALAVALLLAVVAVPVWRSVSVASQRPATPRPSAAARALRRAGAGPALVTGAQFALEPAPGRSPSGVWSSLAGGVVVATILTTAVTFGASLGHLVDTPRLYGWAWDASTDVGDSAPPLEHALRTDDRVAAWSRVTYNRLLVEGVPIPTVGVSPSPHAVVPTVVAGRAPRRGDEIALGSLTMQRLDTTIGQQVTVTTPDGRHRDLDVVGRAVFPGLGTYGGSERTELGKGAMVTMSALRRLGPNINSGSVLVRLVPGTDADAFARDTTAVLRAAGVDEDKISIAFTPKRPTDIVALARVRRAPLVLAVLLAGLILVQLVIVLFTSSRGRRHDLALLKTVGFLRRQVAGTVAWQTVTFTVIALLVGVPLGIAVGRTLWTTLAGHLGAAAEPVTPITLVLVLVGGTLVVGATLAFAGGALLARTPPATVLRSE